MKYMLNNVCVMCADVRVRVRARVPSVQALLQMFLITHTHTRTHALIFHRYGQPMLKRFVHAINKMNVIVPAANPAPAQSHSITERLHIVDTLKNRVDRRSMTMQALRRKNLNHVFRPILFSLFLFCPLCFVSSLFYSCLKIHMLNGKTILLCYI